MIHQAIKVDGVLKRQRFSFYLCLVLAAVFALVFADSFSARCSRSSLVNAFSSIRSERVVIAVEGMYCDSCAAGIKAMLKRTPGVTSADVSYQKKEAVVEYDAQKTTPEKIIEAINNLGYKATVKTKA